MAGFDETSILELGRNPISPDAPCGQDVGDDEDYLAVEAETARLDRIDLGEPDWFAMEQGALNILRSKSKDVDMAIALGQTLFKKERYAGLAATLALFAELTANFWDNLFPGRPRRRKNGMEGFTEKLVDDRWISDAPPKSTDDFDAVDLCLERVAALETALKEKMPDEEISFNKFKRKLKELAGQRPKQAPPPQAASEGGATAAPTAGAAPSGGGAFSAGDVQDVSGAINAILAAGTFIRGADATEPIAYAIPRLIKWSKIELPASDAARTQIEPPDKNTVEALEHQCTNGVWDHLLKNSESAFRAGDPLWLDLQRYTCAALTGLGPQYDKAKQAIISLTAGLVRRLGDGVFELAFRGGQALCGGETKMWIESEVTAGAGGGGGGGGGASNGKLAEASDAARKLAGTGKLREAVEKLREGLLTCNQRRDRFLWRAQIARLCFDAKKLQLAAPLLEECHQEIQRYHIEDWEPQLAVEVAQTLYRCRKALVAAEKAPTPEALASVRAAFAWLCQLDPLAALSADPAG